MSQRVGLGGVPRGGQEWGAQRGREAGAGVGGLALSPPSTLPTPRGLAAYNTSVDLGPDGQILGERRLAWQGSSQPVAPGPRGPRDGPSCCTFSPSSFVGAPSYVLGGRRSEVVVPQLLALRLHPCRPCFHLPTPSTLSSAGAHGQTPSAPPDRGRASGAPPSCWFCRVCANQLQALHPELITDPQWWQQGLNPGPWGPEGARGWL